MKTYKCFDYSDLPQQCKDQIKGRVRHNNSYLNYCPGDEYFKPLEEVKNTLKVMFYEDSVYEKGDDPTGDYLMANGAGLCEEVLILVNW